MAERTDNRSSDQMRPVRITRGYLRNAEGSALIEMGTTTVVCAASVDESVPRFLKGKGQGWVTAEYGMLPRSTNERMSRDGRRGSVSGRTQEIQRLIGRSLRSVIDMNALGECTIMIDCDVLEADGGTRTASITGSFVALYDAIQWLKEKGFVDPDKKILADFVAAISVGIVQGTPMLDLCYVEDSAADVDMNLVMTGRGKFIEIQGTAERDPLSSDDLKSMLNLGRLGAERLISEQKEALGLSPLAAL